MPLLRRRITFSRSNPTFVQCRHLFADTSTSSVVSVGVFCADTNCGNTVSLNRAMIVIGVVVVVNLIYFYYLCFISISILASFV